MIFFPFCGMRASPPPPLQITFVIFTSVFWIAKLKIKHLLPSTYKSVVNKMYPHGRFSFFQLYWGKFVYCKTPHGRFLEKNFFVFKGNCFSDYLSKYPSSWSSLKRWESTEKYRTCSFLGEPSCRLLYDSACVCQALWWVLGLISGYSMAPTLRSLAFKSGTQHVR